MQAVILAGGFGSRLSEETHLKPKPLVDIGGMPILWHIMKIYSSHGINDFVICLGYKGYLIKEYFQNYFLHASDVEIDIANNSIKYLRKDAETWNIKLIDTGANSMTGGRLKRVQDYIEGDVHKEHDHGIGRISGIYWVRANENAGGLQFRNPKSNRSPTFPPDSVTFYLCTVIV